MLKSDKIDKQKKKIDEDLLFHVEQLLKIAKRNYNYLIFNYL